MNKCRCPYCNQKAISHWKKFNLLSGGFFTPSGTAICKCCNKIITVPQWVGFFDTAILIIVIFPTFVVPVSYLRSIVLIFGLSCLILYSVFYSLFVPLIKCDN